MKQRSLILLAVWASLIGIGLAHLRFDVEVLNLLPGNLPSVRGLKLYQERFANANELILTVEAPAAREAEAAAKGLALKLRNASNLVSEVTWQPPWLEHPFSAGNFLGYLWLNQSPAEFSALAARLAPQNAEAVLNDTEERLQSSLSPADFGRLAYDPYQLLQLPGAASPAQLEGGDQLFASPDGTFRLIFIRAATPLPGYRECIKWLKQIDNILAAFKQEPAFASITFGYTGRPAFVAEISSGMEKDVTGSVIGTALLIAALFYVAHRRFKPLLLTLVSLFILLLTTLALGSLLLGTLNVISTGFAAILLGLAVDYALILYQEQVSHQFHSVRELRRSCQAAILFSGATTAGAFLMLNLAHLPGLAQLGTMVALGILLSAVFMLFVFAPLALKMAEARPTKTLQLSPRTPPAPALVLVATLTGFSLLVGILLFAPPQIYGGPDALRPKKSFAYDTLDRIKLRMSRGSEPFWLLAQGKSFLEIAQKFLRAETILAQAKSDRLISDYTLPTPIWPDAEAQKHNKPLAASIISNSAFLHQLATNHGFAPESLGMTMSIFATWNAAASNTGVFLPNDPVGRWSMGKVLATNDFEIVGLGLVHPSSNQGDETWMSRLMDEGLLVGSWDRLGREVLAMVESDLLPMVAAMTLIVIMALAFAFRNFKEIALSIFTLIVAALLLHLGMRVLELDWNLMNLMALPLLIGAGIDYGIHVQLELRKVNGDARAMRGTVGRALFLCAGTTVIGFGSLIWAGNAGLASLGAVCAMGVAICFCVAVYILPLWWNALQVQRA
ncbi:MAG: MMPL family transporter [Verrucomicrobiota bacterium]|nr:MMPL family transporter [Verrucomicrobiota bacterium]